MCDRTISNAKVVIKIDVNIDHFETAAYLIKSGGSSVEFLRRYFRRQNLIDLMTQ